MILSISCQVQLFLYSVLLGMATGFLYDLIRLLRRVIVHNLLAIQLEDLLYWIFSAILVFFALLRYNYSEIRPFLVLGLFVGIILYFMALSEFFLNLWLLIIAFLKKIICVIIKIFAFLLAPFKFFFKPMTFIKNKLKFFYKNNKKHLKNMQKCAKLYMVSLIRCIRIIFKKI